MIGCVLFCVVVLVRRRRIEDVLRFGHDDFLNGKREVDAHSGCNVRPRELLIKSKGSFRHQMTESTTVVKQRLEKKKKKKKRIINCGYLLKFVIGFLIEERHEDKEDDIRDRSSISLSIRRKKERKANPHKPQKKGYIEKKKKKKSIYLFNHKPQEDARGKCVTPRQQPVANPFGNLPEPRWQQSEYDDFRRDGQQGHDLQLRRIKSHSDQSLICAQSSS